MSSKHVGCEGGPYQLHGSTWSLQGPRALARRTCSTAALNEFLPPSPLFLQAAQASICCRMAQGCSQGERQRPAPLLDSSSGSSAWEALLQAASVLRSAGEGAEGCCCA